MVILKAETPADDIGFTLDVEAHGSRGAGRRGRRLGSPEGQAREVFGDMPFVRIAQAGGLGAHDAHRERTMNSFRGHQLDEGPGRRLGNLAFMAVLAALMVEHRSRQFLTVDTGFRRVHFLPQGAQIVRGGIGRRGRGAGRRECGGRPERNAAKQQDKQGFTHRSPHFIDARRSAPGLWHSRNKHSCLFFCGTARSLRSRQWEVAPLGFLSER
jgi:hypothetical protein